MMLSDVCLSVAYIGPKSRTERPGRTKIGTEVVHVTRDSRHHFHGQKVKGQLAAGVAGAYCGGLPHNSPEFPCIITLQSSSVDPLRSLEVRA